MKYVVLIIFIIGVGCNNKNVKDSSINVFNFNKLYTIHKQLGEPLPDDWREVHPEISQSVKSYVNTYITLKGRSNKVVYILPIGEFNENHMNTLVITSEFIKEFFGIDVKLLNPLNDTIVPISARRFHLNTEQLHTKYLLYDILKPQIPEDGFAMFAITEKDLYPRDGWNFVFGQASLRDKVGVASLYRLNNENNQQLFARRIMKTVVHELGHIAHIKHCQKYACIMNGSNSLTEADKRPLWLCPACMYKLTWFLDYDAEKRLKKLKDFYSKKGFALEAKFMQKSLEYSLD